jgi:tetratricopeptide (TPR) repeat protein
MRYWESSNVPEGNQWLKIFIDKQNANDFSRAKACALHTYGWLLTWLQKFEEAHTVTDECLALYRSVDDREGEVDALVSLGNIYQFQDDMKKANELEKKALKISQSLKDPWREGNALTYLGWGYSEPEIKFGYWEKAMHLYRETGDQIQLANLLGLYGQFKVMNGEIETGEKRLDEALELWRSNKKANVWENPKIARSLIALIYGRYEEAQAILEEVLHTSEQSGNRMAVLWAKVRMGYVAFHAGNMTEARELLSNSARDFAKDDYTSGNLFALEGLAGLDATLGKPDRAARLIGYADATRERVSETRHIIEQADVDMSIAACKARMGDSAFEETYKEGKKMTINEAMELALTQ